MWVFSSKPGLYPLSTGSAPSIVTITNVCTLPNVSRGQKCPGLKTSALLKGPAGETRQKRERNERRKEGRGKVREKGKEGGAERGQEREREGG